MKPEESFFDFLLGYRKTLAWVAMFLVSVLFRMKGYIDGGQFVDISKATFLGFVSGNSIEHLGNLGKAYFNSKMAEVSKVPDNSKEES